MLKLLVGTACVAVIAAVGYFFMGEYRVHADAVAFEAKCGSFLTLHRAVIATEGKDSTLRKAALAEARNAPECIHARDQ
jgi:hypothetical protein